MAPQQRIPVVALVAGAIACGGAMSAAAAAASCPGNPDAIGVSRVLTVSAKDYPRLGLMQYRDSLPLNDREVVLTFDDGPLPPYTDRVLDILAQHCVKATFFLVGQHSAANPQAARRVYQAGHTIGNHSQNHVRHFDQIGEARAEKEVENGIRAINAALGTDKALAPFFRVPGLGRTRQIENYLQARSMVVWSSDTLADDWTRITANQVLHRALARLEAKRKGILLLHDIQPRTVLMLPALLAELKKRHFRIVHVVPEGASEPTPLPAPALVASAVAEKLGWPRLAAAGGVSVLPARPAPALSAAAAAESSPHELSLQESPAPTAPETATKDPAGPMFDPVPLPPRKKIRLPRRIIKSASVDDSVRYQPMVFW
jgi:peptidoglycan/xylan/chitin deacetylase (PgdA/CDA1 family)